MAFAQAYTDRPSASPLMSNNPFRNKITTSQEQPQKSRPISTNPFLDSNEFQKEPTSTVTPVSSNGINGAADLFGSMNLNGQPTSPRKVPKPFPNGHSGRPENAYLRNVRGAPTSHRPTLSEEERKRQAVPLRRGTELDIFADPTDGVKQSTRRNSESSVRDRPSTLDPEEEKKRRERKSRDPRYNKQKSSKKLDIIDKLDVTSIYGTGLFHHDGPFDACNPNRNKKKHRYAPIHAFPKDSANMLPGGSGPLKKQLDYDKFHGYGQEAHIDYNEAAVVEEEPQYMQRPVPARSTSFNPTAQETVHGEETIGLGTSTFLEGAPASRIAIERRESEMNDIQQANGGVGAEGLSRKKSLAMKIRGVRPNPGRVQSPDSDRGPTSPLATARSDSATNPFFRDYDKEYEKKSQQIAQAEEQVITGRARAPSSPRPMPALERQPTMENSESGQDFKPSGFLGRMKSLKKTKSRPERRDAS